MYCRAASTSAYKEQKELDAQADVLRQEQREVAGKLDEAQKGVASLQSEWDERTRLLAEHVQMLPGHLQEAETVRRQADRQGSRQAGRQADRHDTAVIWAGRREAGGGGGGGMYWYVTITTTTTASCINLQLTHYC